MSNDASVDKGNRKVPVKERRAASSTKKPIGTLGRLKGIFFRPLGLQRRGGRLRLMFIDRRQAPPHDQPPALPQLLAELRATLLAQDHERAAEVMRHLVVVHDELGRRGWPGVEALPSLLLGKAIMQAEMLASQDAASSPSLSLVIDRLRSTKIAAELREERASKLRLRDMDNPLVVSEVTHEEFEASVRDWADHSPQGTKSPSRDP